MELAGPGDGPVDLMAICAERRLGLRVAVRDGERHGGLVRVGSGWEVVVTRDDPRPHPITARERFTIAHEIGHHVLEQETGFRATRRAEYWLGERLCQQFASRLLIRRSFLEEARPCDSSAALMAAVNEVARRAKVSPEPAARALVAEIDEPVAVGAFVLDPLQSTNRLGFRAWWAENRKWWAAGGGRRLAVYTDHPLAPALREMVRLRPWQLGSPVLTGARSTTLRRRGLRWAAFAALLGG